MIVVCCYAYDWRVLKFFVCKIWSWHIRPLFKQYIWLNKAVLLFDVKHNIFCWSLSNLYISCYRATNNRSPSRTRGNPCTLRSTSQPNAERPTHDSRGRRARGWGRLLGIVGLCVWYSLPLNNPLILESCYCKQVFVQVILSMYIV